MTTPQFVARTKDVTRRGGWWKLKPGDIVMGVEKGMGLKLGEKVKRLHEIQIISTRLEQLDAITQDDVIREGFPSITPTQFVEMFCNHNGCKPDAIINRIEFKHL